MLCILTALDLCNFQQQCIVLNRVKESSRRVMSRQRRPLSGERGAAAGRPELVGCQPPRAFTGTGRDGSGRQRRVGLSRVGPALPGGAPRRAVLSGNSITRRTILWPIIRYCEPAKTTNSIHTQASWTLVSTTSLTETIQVSPVGASA